MGTLLAEATLTIFISAFLLNGNQLLKKRTFCPRNKFLPFRVDPTLKGPYYPGKQTGSHRKRLFPFVKIMKNNK